MSKVNPDTLDEAIAEILKSAIERNENRRKNRKFVETIELQMGLKGFDPARDKRINATTVLPTAPKNKYKFCLLGNDAQCEEAEAMNLPFKTLAELKTYKRNKKIVKKLAKEYDMFLASSNLIRQVPRLLGPTLNKVNKFPLPVAATEKVEDKVEELKRTLKGSLKFKVGMPMCLSFPVANCAHDEATIKKNILHLINYLTTQFKKNWQNVRRVHIKTTMGKPIKIYGL